MFNKFFNYYLILFLVLLQGRKMGQSGPPSEGIQRAEKIFYGSASHDQKSRKKSPITGTPRAPHVHSSVPPSEFQYVATALCICYIQCFKRVSLWADSEQLL